MSRDPAAVDVETTWAKKRAAIEARRPVLVLGGQGRTDEDVERSARALGVVLGLLLLVAALGAALVFWGATR